MNQALDRWTLATIAVAALAVDPKGLRGITLRDRPGPVRDAVLELVGKLANQPMRRMPASVDPSVLSGGIDLGATLQGGAAVHTQGLLARHRDSILVVPMAERMEPRIAATIATALDTSDAPTLMLLDEAAEPDEAAPEALSDRLAMSLSLDGVARAEISNPAFDASDVSHAKTVLKDVSVSDQILDALAQLTTAMGITSMRAPLLALHLARVLAALEDSLQVQDHHISIAVALCLAPRATMIPTSDAAQEDPETPPPPPEESSDEQDEGKSEEQGQLEDKVLEAIAAILPDLTLKPARKRGTAGAAGAGDRKRSSSHGRPVRSRPGKPDGNRLDVFATLLAAAPWQKLRRQHAADRQGLIVQPQDFRIKQYDRPAESVLIFLVDASGSQAAARMAEAKGAVELMLSEAYRRREKVALIAFRGTNAEMILPPTRSLLQAKRRLAVLPGGGPTPLAQALRSGHELAIQVRRRGATPYLILLTDGRGNIALSGEPGRKEAAEDQARMARGIAAEGLSCVLVDTANRPQPDAKALAATLLAQYLPLPRADANAINRSVRAGLVA